MSFLTLENVSHHYFSEKNFTKALDNVSLSIKKGEFISILGPSGCGKSTILSIISGIIHPTSGRVLQKKEEVKQVNLELGYMLQQDYLFPWKSIMNNILIGPKVKKENVDKAREEALEMLHEIGLEGVENDFPDSLSGGMRQRVALVRTLITRPEILLLDEPFSALDYQTKLRLENLVFNLLKSYHKTSILVTHDIGEAISMSDRILIMSKNPGRIQQVFEVPIELRNEIPFRVRRHSKYQMMFDRIWGELNKDETVQ